jgi:hypothetical protein
VHSANLFPSALSSLLDSLTACSAWPGLAYGTICIEHFRPSLLQSPDGQPANRSPHDAPGEQFLSLLRIFHASSPACSSNSSIKQRRIAPLGNIDSPLKLPRPGAGQLLWCTKACVRSWLACWGGRLAGWPPAWTSKSVPRSTVHSTAAW